MDRQQLCQRHLQHSCSASKNDLIQW